MTDDWCPENENPTAMLLKTLAAERDAQAARTAELEGQLKNAIAEAQDTGFEREQWKMRAERAEAEVARLREAMEMIVGDVCDITKGEHVVMNERNYRFCIHCGETMTSSKIKAAKKAVRARAALQEKPHE